MGRLYVSYLQTMNRTIHKVKIQQSFVDCRWNILLLLLLLYCGYKTVETINHFVFSRVLPRLEHLLSVLMLGRTSRYFTVLRLHHNATPARLTNSVTSHRWFMKHGFMFGIK